MIFQPATLKFPGFISDMADASSHGHEQQPGGTDPQQTPGAPKAAFPPQTPLPKNVQLFLEHPATNLLETSAGVSGVKCVCRGVSQSREYPKGMPCVHLPDLAWLVPGTALWSLTTSWWNIGQHRMGSTLSPGPADTKSSSSCGHIDVSFSWEPNPLSTAAHPVETSTSCSFSMGYFWMLLPCAGGSPLPSKPPGCPSFPTHLQMTPNIQAAAAAAFLMASMETGFPQGTRTRVPQMSFSLCRYSRYCYLFALSDKKELLSVSLPQLSDKKLLH